ncbi:MAG TPA: ABC transporter ATP-binding protein [Armatimonadota bacterium]
MTSVSVDPAAGPIPCPTAPKLELRRVSRHFATPRGPVPALKELSFTVAPSELVCVLGPSGCGKSTLLNLLAGLDRPDEGCVLEDGAAITGASRDRMVMQQEPALFPWLTARGNVEFALKATGLSKAERRERAEEYLHLVGLGSFGRAHPHELSGGMKQRCALARALALDPSVLLLDEPFAALDALTSDRLHEALERIWQQTGKTIVFVTHNVREAVRLGDRVLTLSARPARLLQEVRVELPRPREQEDPALAALAAQVKRSLSAEIGRHLAEELYEGAG